MFVKGGKVVFSGTTTQLEITYVRKALRHCRGTFVRVKQELLPHPSPIVAFLSLMVLWQRERCVDP